MGFKQGEHAPLLNNGTLSPKMISAIKDIYKKSKGTMSYKDFKRVHDKML